jgi:hypothetical protein
MLILLRILFGAGLAYGFKKAWENAQAAPETGDLTNAFYVAFCVILAIANAVVWAPYFGAKLSDPLTGAITKSTFVDRKNHLLRLVRWLDDRRHRRLALFFCFLEGVHHPDFPAAFVIGLSNARPGSWLEKVFALEVFRFDNAQHCMTAYEVLKRHGIDPRPHHNPEINMVLLSVERQVKPDPDKLAVPKAVESAPLKRDRRIRLFQSAEAGDAQESAHREDGAGTEPSSCELDSLTEPGIEPTSGTDSVSTEPVQQPKATDAGADILGRLRAFLRGG